jgi:hypothetical protein
MTQERVDARSVGELLLDADLTSRASLWDVSPEDAKARVRSWGEVVEAAADLWASIPDASNNPSMRRIAELTQGLHRTHMRSGWPGAGPGDPHLESIAASLSRAAELVGARRHPTAVLSLPGQRDAEAARTRLMHVLYVSAHSVGVALGHHTRDLQRRLDTRQSIPTGDSLKLARDTKERVAAVERLAGAFLHPRWPAALTGEHRDGANLQRLEQALARWDLQAHRSLAALPTTANLTWTARVQQDIVVATAVVASAAARLGHLPAESVERSRSALAQLDHAWAALATDLTALQGRQRRLDPELLLAGREVQAALRDITHQHPGLAAPQAIAARVDLTATAGHLHQSLTAAVALAHVTRDALCDPELTVAARGAHAMATSSAAAQGMAAWVDAGSLHLNHQVPLPAPVRATLTSRADHVVEAAITADSASAGLRPSSRPFEPKPQPSAGRQHEDRVPPMLGRDQVPGMLIVADR